MKRVTIKDVARLAGVSASTVSRVLSGSAAISDETCERVRDAVEKLGYEPNIAARSLRSDKSMSIGVVLPDISGEFYSLCASSILKYARMIGYTVLFIESGKELGAESDGIRVLLQNGVDGMIFIGGGNDSEIVKTAAEKVKVITGDRKVNGIASVTFNNRATVYRLTSALYNAGCRRFLYVGETFNGFENLAERYSGFTEALSCHSDAVMMTLLEDSLHRDKLSESYRLFMEKIKEMEPEAVVTSNDLIAQGIISAANKTGVRIPEQMSVTGFDDMTSSAYYTPSVTTVRQDADELSRLCFSGLIDMLDGKDIKSCGIKQKIIPRASALIGEGDL